MEHCKLPHLVEQEMRLIHVLCDMERIGVKINKAKLNATTVRYRRKIEALNLEFKKEFSFPITSRKQIDAYVLKKIPDIPRTKTGKVCLDKEVLAKYPEEPIMQKLSEKRTNEKIQTTYLKGLLTHITTNKTIHCNYNQHGALTGRMSCKEPNLQNQQK